MLISEAEERPSKTLHGLVAFNTLRKMRTGATRSLRMARASLATHYEIKLHFVAVRSPWHFFGPFLAARRLRYDFLLFNGLASLATHSHFGYPLWQIARWRKVPLFLYWHETAWTLDRHAREQPASARRLRSLVQETEIVHLTASEATSESVKTRYGKVHTCTIYECAHIPKPFLTLSQPAEPPTVVNLASIQPRKGTDLWVETAIKVCNEHPTVEFIWLGTGESFGDWQQAIVKAGLEERILFPGYVDAPYLLLRRASVFFLSSRDDPFPLSVLEAMALGRSIVAFDVGGAPEALAGKGQIMPAFDTDAAAVAILQILARLPAQRVQPVLQERYKELYSPEAFSRRLNEVIRANL